MSKQLGVAPFVGFLHPGRLYRGDFDFGKGWALSFDSSFRWNKFPQLIRIGE
jgi:hypothetical protein